MLTSKDVAEYFLALSNNDEGELISNLKIQKLVYYAQGFSLAILGRPLFNEDIEAWMHGPVVPSLYREYKQHGNGAIPMTGLDIDFSKYTKDEEEIIEDVFHMYGQFSAWKLRDLTHDEPTWKNHYSPHAHPSNETIPKEEMKDFFKTLID